MCLNIQEWCALLIRGFQALTQGLKNKNDGKIEDHAISHRKKDLVLFVLYYVTGHASWGRHFTSLDLNFIIK